MGNIRSGGIKAIKVIAVMLLLAVISSSGICKKPIKLISEYDPIEKVGILPDEFTESIIENELLTQAIEISDGYLLPTTSEEGKNYVTKFDESGEVLWSREYELTPEGSRNGYTIVPTPDWGYILGIVGYSYHKPEGGMFTTNPIIAKCDEDGNLLWSKTYEGFSYTIFERIFCLPNGDIITIGSNETPETKEIGVGSSTDVYLSKLDSEGNLLNERIYGGSDFDSVDNAEYIEGAGIAASIDTQSLDGTFSASKDLYPVGVIALFDLDLNIKWQKNFGHYFDSMVLYNNEIYILDSKNIKRGEALCNYKLHKLDVKGNLVFTKELCDSTGINIVNGSEIGVLLDCPDKFLLLDDEGKEKLEVPFDAGGIVKVLKHNDYFLIISSHITGKLPQPPTISSIWFSSELVYSGYDYNGNLLWRDAYDNTPEYMRSYDPEKDTNWWIVGE